MARFLIKPSANKKRDQVFKVFHQLNLKDAVNYVAEVRFYFFSFFLMGAAGKVTNLDDMFQGESRGSLEFVHNESAFVDFKKKFDIEHEDIMPDIMPEASEAHVSVPDKRWAIVIYSLFVSIYACQAQETCRN